MTDLLLHPAAEADADGTFLRVTPESAGWRHVGFSCPSRMANRPATASRSTGERKKRLQF